MRDVVFSLMPEVIKCWQCGQPNGGLLFCPHCQALQPPPRDLFRILDFEPRLVIDSEALQRRFYELSRRLHPDRFTRNSAREQAYSEDAMSLVNDAYRTLRDPVTRGEYVLKREGLDIGEQRSKDVPPELLEEVFELNMALEELRSGDDDARPQLQDSQSRFDNMLQDVDRQLYAAYAQHDATPGPDTLAQIRGILNKRRYIQNLIRDVQAALA